MARVKVTKRPGRKRYYAFLEGRYVSTGHTDQRLASDAAQRMAAVGVQAFREGKRTLSNRLPALIEDHLKHLAECDGRDAEHIRKKRTHLMSPVDAGVFRVVRDVNKRAMAQWLESLTCGPKTRNEYLTSWNVFLDWLVFEDRLDENPIRGRIRRARVRSEDQRERRAFTLEELRRLLGVAGPRWLVYLIAATTGARKSELGQLRWADVHENASNPHVVLLASTTKNGKQRTQWLTDEAASALAEARQAASTDRVFPTMPSHHTVDKDLKNAGITKTTDDGVLSFHCLRHTYATFVARASKDVRLVQRMVDHADITTTQRYLHAEPIEQITTMKGFPRLIAAGRATGRASDVVQSGQIMPTEGEACPSVSWSQVWSTRVQRWRTVSVNGAGGNRTPVPRRTTWRLYACSRRLYFSSRDPDDGVSQAKRWLSLIPSPRRSVSGTSPMSFTRPLSGVMSG